MKSTLSLGVVVGGLLGIAAGLLARAWLVMLCLGAAFSYGAHVPDLGLGASFFVVLAFQILTTSTSAVRKSYEATK